MNKSFFQNTLSIKNKLLLVTSVAVGFSLFWVLILFIYINSENEWSKINARLTIQGEIIANNSMPAVIFDDFQAAKEILAALKADGSIKKAKIVTNTDVVFAYFEKPSSIDNIQLYDKFTPLVKW